MKEFIFAKIPLRSNSVKNSFEVEVIKKKGIIHDVINSNKHEMCVLRCVRVM